MLTSKPRDLMGARRLNVKGQHSEPSRQPKFSASLVTTRMENTVVALTRIATDSFSYVCSQNLWLLSYRYPLNSEITLTLTGHDPSRSSQMLQCSHIRLPSGFLYHFLSFQAWQGIQETISTLGNSKG
ncbi:hypothetical protein LEMLEM_LOCUS13949 [Lemmus lemmus]